MAEKKIIDFISGLSINDTPEEREAVQVFARLLVEDYGYNKNQIQTHPQTRVKSRPSDTKKEYPVDIAVYTSSQKQESELFLIVECKKTNSKDGKTQLENYLTLSPAYLGVWFNGQETLFLQKFVNTNGQVLFKEIPNIPILGQRIEDIGLFKRENLKPTHNLKFIFKSIRNYLAANNVGATRDEVLAQQLINIIFCKLYDEKYTAPEDIVRFRAGINESAEIVVGRLNELFLDVKNNNPEVIKAEDNFSLDNKSLIYVIGALQNYSLINSERDVVADAFETFIGHALKGEKGQFFTPRNLVKLCVQMLNPTENDKIIDPACGSGGFLIDTLKHIWLQIEQRYQKLNWKPAQIAIKKIETAARNFRGLDKDNFLSKVAKAYMNLVGDGTTGIFCEDSLEQPKNWDIKTQQQIQLASFDIILTNPPFGKNIKVEGKEKLAQYDVAHKWKKNKEGYWQKDKLKPHEAPEVLFIERCLQLLKENGRMAIILPDGFFNDSMAYLRYWLLARCKILAVVDVPKETFQPNTSTKTSFLLLQKQENTSLDYPVFMSIAHYCGHNRRGKSIEQDDMPTILATYQQYLQTGQSNNENSFVVSVADLYQTDFWIPKHFYPYYKKGLDKLKLQYQTLPLAEIASIKKGDEVGSHNYIAFVDREPSDVAFLRTGDLVNFGVNQFADNFIDAQIYENVNQDLQTNDILYTKDGKIGITAMLTPADKVMIASGIARIRLKPAAAKYHLTQEYLFAVLSDKFLGQFQSLRRTIVAATIPHLREKRLGEFEIPLLPKEKIDAISQIVKQTFALKDQAKQLDSQIVNTFANYWI